MDATWNTGAVGDWGDPNNWDIDPVFPDNNGDTYNVFINDGETTIDGAFTIDDLTLDGGALVGSGTLDVGGTFTWLSGALGGDGATAEININGDAVIDTGFHNFAAVTVNFAGNTTWVNGNIVSIEPPEGGVFNNSGTFEVQGDVLWFWDVTAAPVFNNEVGGVFSRTTSSGLAEIWAAFNNDGDVIVETGTLQLAGGGASTGTFTVDPNAELFISDFNEFFGFAGAPATTLDPNSVIDSSGTVTFGNLGDGSNTEINGTIDSAAVIADPGATGEVRFTSDSFYGDNSPGTFEAVSGKTVFDGNSATVTDATVRDTATVDVLQYGSLNLEGDLTIDAGGMINLGDPNGGGDLAFSGITPRSILGDGEIVFGPTTGSSITGAGLLIGADMTIRGAGSIFASGAANGANSGTITSDVNGQFSFIRDLNNSGLIEATNGASLDYSDFDFLGTLVNTGTIQVSGGGDLVTRNLVNQDMVSIDGGRLRLEGENFTNVGGTIVGNNAVIEFRNGTFTFAEVGVVNRTNTDLELGNFAILDNTGGTLDLDNLTGQQGTWTMRGGSILGGSIQSSGGATLLFPATGSNRFGTLDGVTLNTGPTMGDGSSMFVDNGLTLNSTTVDLSNGGTGAANMTFQLGTRTLSGTGTVILGNDINRGVGTSIGGGNFTVASGILIRGQAGFVSRATNQGTVSADVNGGSVSFRNSINDVGGLLEAKNGGILRLENDWDNNGTIDVQTGSTLWLQGTNPTADIGTVQRAASTTVRLTGTLTNTGDVLDLQADLGGDFELRQGTIVGGTVNSSGAAKLLIDGENITGSEFQGVTFGADVGFTDGNNGVVKISGGLTLDNSTFAVENNFAPDVTFSGNSQTVGGTGQFIVRATSGSTEVRNASITGGTVTFGPNITMLVSSSSQFNSVTFQGKFNAAAGGYFNQGLIHIDGTMSQINMDELENQGGTIRVDAGNILDLGNSPGETVFVQSGGEFVLDGKLDAANDIEIRGGTFSGSGFVQFVTGTFRHLLAESGGAIAPGGSIDTLLVDGDVVIGDGGHFAVEVNSYGDADLLDIIKGTFQTVNGDLDLSSSSDFLDVTNLAGNVNGAQFVVIQYDGARIGTFDNVTPGVNVIYDDPNKQILVEPVSLAEVFDADFDDDHDVDGIDFLIWQRGYNLTGQTDNSNGDANFDGSVNSADLAVWENQYGTVVPLTAANAAVPEPGSAMLVFAGGLLLAGRRRVGWKSVG